MLRSLLVGLDGSPYSEAAVELGLAWAKRFECQLAAVGVIDEPTITGPEAIPVGGGAFKQETGEAQIAAAHQRIEKLLSKFAQQCSEAGVACKLLEDVGLPSEEIVREAQRYDLILMGQETYFHSDTRETSGDTLEQILRKTPRPVVAVPDQLVTGSGVLVAYDGNVQAARSLQTFLATGLQAGAEIQVITIHPKSSVEAAKIADRAVEFLGFHQIKAAALPVESKDSVADTIVAEAQRLDVELVVMGCYSHSRLRDFFLGSVTRKVIQNSDRPLFLYH